MRGWVGVWVVSTSPVSGIYLLRFSAQAKDPDMPSVLRDAVDDTVRGITGQFGWRFALGEDELRIAFSACQDCFGR